MSGSSGILSYSGSATVGQRGQQIAEICRSIHDRLVGGIVSNVVVIDNESGVERRVFVGVVQADAEEILVDGGINRAIEESAGQLDVHLLRNDGVRIVREHSVVR